MFVEIGFDKKGISSGKGLVKIMVKIMGLNYGEKFCENLVNYKVNIVG